MKFRAWYLAAALPLAAACSHAQKVTAKAPAPPAPVVAEPTTPPAPPATPAATSCTSDDQCSAKQLCVSDSCVDITPELAECRTSAHFDFDRAVLHQDDLPKLRREARCLNALPDERTLVAGNCDERGTAQYNIALGFRRAHVVAKYIEDLGVAPAELNEVSYGKELPVCTQASESCWARNRRTDVTPGATAKSVAALLRRDERREREAVRETKSAKTVASARSPVKAHRASDKQPVTADSAAASKK